MNIYKDFQSLIRNKSNLNTPNPTNKTKTQTIPNLTITNRSHHSISIHHEFDM